jgi:RNAse (barnase) inhibitor barstar
MAAFWSTLLSAIILGPLVVVFQRFRKENSSQHAESRTLLEQVIKTVDKVDNRLEGHIDWHLTDKEK